MLCFLVSLGVLDWRDELWQSMRCKNQGYVRTGLLTELSNLISPRNDCVIYILYINLQTVWSAGIWYCSCWICHPVALFWSATNSNNPGNHAKPGLKLWQRFIIYHHDHCSMSSCGRDLYAIYQDKMLFDCVTYQFPAAFDYTALKCTGTCWDIEYLVPIGLFLKARYERENPILGRFDFESASTFSGGCSRQ